MQKANIKGVEVIYNFFPGENIAISHGEFYLNNLGAKSIQIKIIDCFIVEGIEKNKIENFNVYYDDTSIGKTFTVLPIQPMLIRITFPFRKITKEKNKKYSLEIDVLIENEIINATSEIQVFFEKNFKE